MATGIRTGTVEALYTNVRDTFVKFSSSQERWEDSHPKFGTLRQSIDAMRVDLNERTELYLGDEDYLNQSSPEIRTHLNSVKLLDQTERLYERLVFLNESRWTRFVSSVPRAKEDWVDRIGDLIFYLSMANVFISLFRRN